MFDIRRVIGNYIYEKNVATGFEFVEEGMLAIRVLENGEEAVKPSEGLTGEHFAGFNVISNLSPSSESLVEDYVIGVSISNTIKLASTNVLGNELRVIDNTDSADSATNSPIVPRFVFVSTPPINSLQIYVNYDSGVLQFYPTRNGNNVRVYYRHLLTVREARQKYHERQQFSNIDPEVYNQVGLYAGTGIIFTDQYDINKDYTNVGYGELRSGSDGKVTVGGNGTHVGAVIRTPAINYAYLGIQYTVLNL